MEKDISNPQPVAVKFSEDLIPKYSLVDDLALEYMAIYIILGALLGFVSGDWLISSDWILGLMGGHLLANGFFSSKTRLLGKRVREAIKKYDQDMEKAEDFS